MVENGKFEAVVSLLFFGNMSFICNFAESKLIIINTSKL